MTQYNLGTARGSAEIDTSDIRNASKELKNADIVLTRTGQSLISFGQQALGAFGYVVGIGAQFEKEMSFVQAVTNATASEMEGLKKTAIELGKTGRFGPVELAGAFVELAKAGIDAQDIIDGVGSAVSNLAAAADIDAVAAGQIVVQTMAIFGLAAKDIPRATDIIAGAANASLIDVQDFATTLKYTGPVASALGIDLEDLATTISLLGQSGIKGSIAGTSLRQTLLNLAGATPRARDRMEELGIITQDGSNIFYDAQGNIKDLTTVFELLGKSVAGLNEKQKGEALRDIFGVRQLPTVLFLLNQGRDQFEAFNNEINETTAADVASKRLDNLDGAIKRFKATLESVLLGPAGGFQKMLQRMVEMGTRFLLFLDALPGPVKTFLLGLVGVIGVLSILSGVFLLTVGSIVRAVRVFGELATVAAKLPGLLRPIIGAIRGVSAAFLASPIFWIIAAVVALAVAFYLLYTRVEGFRKFIDKTWQTIQKIWDAILGFVKRIPEMVAKAWDTLKTKTAEVWDAVYAKVSEVIGAVIGFFERLPGNIAGALGSLWRTITGFFDNLVVAIAGFFADLPGKIASALGTAAKAIGDFFSALPGIVGKAIGFTIGLLLRIPVEIIKAFIKYGPRIVKALIGALTRLPGQIGRILSSIFSTLTRWGASAISTAVRIGTGIVTGIISFLASLPAKVLAILVAILTFLVTKIPEFIAAAVRIGGGIVSGIIDFLIGLPSLVWNIITGVLGDLVGLADSFFDAAVNIGSSIVSGIIDFITDLPSLVGDILSSVISAFTGLIGRAFEAAKSFASGLWEGFKKGLGINSPSFIEESMFAIQDQAKLTNKLLNREISRMGLAGKNFVSSINSGVLGLPTPAAVAAGGGMTFNQNAPLVGQAVIRDDRDIKVLARDLETERKRQARARGRDA